MNARVSTPRTVPPLQPSDFELEGDAIGIALLGYPLPDWLEPGDFLSGKLRAAFEAYLALGGAANLPTIYAYLRDVASGPYSPPAMSAADLYTLMDEADHAMTMGWAVDFGRLRELRRQRELLEVIAKIQIGFRLGGLDWSEAKGMLEVVL